MQDLPMPPTTRGRVQDYATLLELLRLERLWKQFFQATQSPVLAASLPDRDTIFTQLMALSPQVRQRFQVTSEKSWDLLSMNNASSSSPT